MEGEFGKVLAHCFMKQAKVWVGWSTGAKGVIDGCVKRDWHDFPTKSKYTHRLGSCENMSSSLQDREYISSDYVRILTVPCLEVEVRSAITTG